MQFIMPLLLILMATAALPRATAQSYPVSGVVELLRNMQSELEAEADKDQEVYEKLACWCTTNDREKTKAIADAESRIADLGSTIEKMTHLSKTLTVEIKNLEKEVAKNQESLDIATALRKKQREEFVGEEKEMVQSIQALNGAIVVLSKHHGDAALVNVQSVMEAAAAAHAQLMRHGALLQGTVSPSERRMLQSFVQQREEPSKGFIGKKPTFKQEYKPQSGQIFGILKEMKATFENDLSASQKEEIQAAEAYESLKVAKEEEIKAGQASLEEKQQQLAKADETKVQAEEEKADTESSLTADQKFLMDLKEKCSLTDEEWKQRQKTRNEEIAAVSEAIAILMSDDSRDLFSRTFNAGAALVQIHRNTVVHGTSNQRARAAALLMQVATKTQSPKLAVLATAAQLDSFTRVKKAIDDMVAQLLKEKDLEIKHRDNCIANLNTNELTTEKEAHAKANLEQKVEGLKKTVATLASAIEVLKSEIAELELQKKRAKEDRERQHKEFMLTIGDQKGAHKLLTQAYGVLKKFYADKAEELLQVQHRQPEAPPGFKPYEKSGAAVSVLALLEKIIGDTKTMAEETEQAEQDAADAFKKTVEETEASVKAKSGSIVDRTAEKTQAEEDLQQAQTELEGVVAELESLTKDAAALRGECDYVLKNFDLRQEARDEEVAALRQAKAYLSGAK